MAGAGPAALAVLLVLLADAAASASAFAAPAPRLLSPAHVTVRAGQKLEIRWAANGEAGELEILLSLDGGRHYPLRISPELDARAGRFVWRVPNLSCADARLELRFESHGGERTSEPGEPFVIEADARRPIERAAVAEGVWWQGLDETRSAAAALGDARGPVLAAERVALAADTSPRDPLAPARSGERRTSITAPVAAPSPASPPARGLMRTLPLRN